jgi:hypothetical protein
MKTFYLFILILQIHRPRIWIKTSERYFSMEITSNTYSHKERSTKDR